jgi:hypothetical protein
MRTAARRRLRRHRDRRTSPRTRGSSRVFSKNLTATSPVTTPRPSVSACRKSWVNTRFSSGVRLRLGAAAYVVSQQVRNSKKHLRPFAPLSPLRDGPQVPGGSSAGPGPRMTRRPSRARTVSRKNKLSPGSSAMALPLRPSGETASCCPRQVSEENEGDRSWSEWCWSDAGRERRKLQRRKLCNVFAQRR